MAKWWVCFAFVCGAIEVPNVTLPDGTAVMGGSHAAGLATYAGIKYGEAARFELGRPWSYPAGSVVDGRSPDQHVCWYVQGGSVSGAEACLYLDVVVPAPRPSSPAAVMVWIHGGGLMTGDKGENNPANMASSGDIVVVALNYRLNILGFFTHEDGSVPTNNGIRDQILGLKWVQGNIGSFAGDASRVTIFGESAGGLSVMVLHQSPLATGLFHRAIAQSPGWQNAALFHHPSHDATASLSKQCMQAVGCSSVDCMKAQSLDQLAQSCTSFVNGSFIPSPETYFTGFDGDVLPTSLYERLCNSATEVANAEVPLIAGSMPYEWRLLETVGFPASKSIEKFLTEYLGGYADASSSNQDCAHGKLLDLYKDAGSHNHCPLCFLFAGKADAVQLAGDIELTMGAQLAVSARGGPRYRYLFDVDNGGSVLGATHGWDLMYFNDEPGKHDLSLGVLRNKQKRELGKMLREYWTSFAKTGVPSSSDGPTWEPVSEASGLLGLPQLRMGLGHGKTSMESEGWYTNETASMLSRMACGELDVAALGCGPSEALSV